MSVKISIYLLILSSFPLAMKYFIGKNKNNLLFENSF